MKMDIPNRLNPHVVGAFGFSLAILVSGCQSRPDEGGNTLLKDQSAPASSSLTANSGRFTSRTVTLRNGIVLKQTAINGPRRRPAGLNAASALLSPSDAGGVNSLSVPAYDWSFGAAATSGAMIAAYYDRNGFDSIYTGPTNGSVMPLDSSAWPDWTDGVGDTYAQVPLAASHNGLDGRTTRGSIDDYWIELGSTSADPYITGAWTQHAWGDAIGDYMKTSQSAYSNDDGSTTFFTNTPLADRLTCADMVAYGIDSTDGTYGRKLFYEARGYAVSDCYNQDTDNKVAGGFSFAQYQVEIDAGRPVMLNLNGHTIVGVGYDNSTNTVYLNDTWDYLTHSMTWGGAYAGMDLLSVSIVNPVPSAPTAVAATDGTFPDKVQVSWTPSLGATSYQVYRNTSNSSTGVAQIGTPAASPFDDTTATPGATYYYFVKACNTQGCSDFSLSDSGYRSGAPPNDDFAAATTLGVVPFLSSIDVTYATAAGDDPALTACSQPAGAKSVWYSYTPGTSRSVYLDTFGSNYDTTVGVFTGTRGSLTAIVCNDDDARSPGGLNSAVALNATAGTTYYIVVYAKAGATTPTLLQFHATSFYDVPGNYVFWRFIEGFYSQGITTGCGASPLSYCPENSVTRAEMAVFLLRAMHGGAYQPPPLSGIFADVPVTGKEWMQPWVEEFYREGMTTGCGANPLQYCPEAHTTRAEMSVFVLRSTHGPAYQPPATTGIFSDLPVVGKEWMQAWVEEYYREAITTGCAANPLRYCPENSVTRAEMAVFVSRAYSITQLP